MNQYFYIYIVNQARMYRLDTLNIFINILRRTQFSFKQKYLCNLNSEPCIVRYSKWCFVHSAKDSCGIYNLSSTFLGTYLALNFTR